MNTEYQPRPIDTSHVNLPPELEALAQKLALNVHEVWSQHRMQEGWKYGPERDDAQRQTPCLVPYEELPQVEKDYDLHTAMETLKLIVQLGFEILPPKDKSPE